MGKVFKVEIRKTCKICGKPLDSKKRQRTYDSKDCRRKGEWKNRFERETPEQREKRLSYGRKKYSKPSKDKKKCLLCEGWYVQVGTHVIQRHHLTAREYKEYFDLPLKRGVMPEWYREKKAEIARENGTASILPRVGMRTRYKKGDVRAKKVSGWKGRLGSKRVEI